MDTLPENEGQKEEVIRQRDKTYYGSPMHFIRAVYNENTLKQGFTLLTKDEFLLITDSILFVDTPDKKRLVCPNEIHVTYREDGEHEQSWLTIENGETRIFENGYFESPIHWFGYWSTERVAYQLPYDFQPMRER